MPQTLYLEFLCLAKFFDNRSSMGILNGCLSQSEVVTYYTDRLPGFWDNHSFFVAFLAPSNSRAALWLNNKYASLTIVVILGFSRMIWSRCPKRLSLNLLCLGSPFVFWRISGSALFHFPSGRWSAKIRCSRRAIAGSMIRRITSTLSSCFQGCTSAMNNGSLLTVSMLQNESVTGCHNSLWVVGTADNKVVNELLVLHTYVHQVNATVFYRAPERHCNEKRD